MGLFELKRGHGEKFPDAWLSGLRTHDEVLAKFPFHKGRFTFEEAENGGSNSSVLLKDLLVP